MFGHDFKSVSSESNSAKSPNKVGDSDGDE